MTGGGLATRCGWDSRGPGRSEEKQSEEGEVDGEAEEAEEGELFAPEEGTGAAGESQERKAFQGGQDGLRSDLAGGVREDEQQHEGEHAEIREGDGEAAIEGDAAGVGFGGGHGGGVVDGLGGGTGLFSFQGGGFLATPIPDEPGDQDQPDRQDNGGVTDDVPEGG